MRATLHLRVNACLLSAPHFFSPKGFSLCFKKQSGLKRYFWFYQVVHWGAFGKLFYEMRFLGQLGKLREGLAQSSIS